MPIKHHYHPISNFVHTTHNFFFQMGTTTHTVPCADGGINTVQVEQAVVKSTAIFLLFSS